MADNSLYPGFVKLFYTAATREHVATLPCKPFEVVGGGWAVERYPAPAQSSWTAAVDAYVTVLRPFIQTTGSFDRAELWTLDAPEGDPLFREAHDINLAGTGGAPVAPYTQQVATFRTRSGGMKRTPEHPLMCAEKHTHKMRCA